MPGATHLSDLVNLGDLVKRDADPKALRDSFAIRRAALNRGLPYFTTLAAMRAAAGAIHAMRLGSIGVRSLQEIHPAT